MSQGKILIDGVIFQLQHGKPGGISRVWKNHLEQLANSPLRDRLLLLDRAETLPDFPGLARKVIEPYDLMAFEADPLYLQEIFDQEEGDLLISTYYTYLENSPTMIMLHDMTPEIMGLDLNFPEWRAKAQAIEKSCAYFAVSNSTKRDFKKLFPDQKHKSISVVPNAASTVFSKQPKREIRRFKNTYQIEQPYFLLVGNRNMYKNAQMFFRAFALLENRTDYEIFCTGGQAKLERAYRGFLGGARCQVQHLSDQGLALAYAGALCLVYPSLYEGFGLPILEAQQCGCPVITYTNSSLSEVGGAGAIYPEMHDAASMREALLKIQQKEVREELILAGYQNAGRYSWPESSQRMVEAIERVFQKLPTIPRNPSAPLYAGIRLAYDLSKLPGTSQLANFLQQTIRYISAHPLSLDFQPLASLEREIQRLITPGVLKQLEKLGRSPESDGYIHYWLGLAYQQQGEDLWALEEYLSAMKLNLESSRIAYLAAGLAYQEQEWELAQHLWESLANLQLPEAEQMLMKVQQKALKGKKSPREEHNQLFFLKELSPPPPINGGKPEQDPAVSVILPTKDRLQGVEAFLNSLPEAADGHPYEVLVYAGGDCLAELKRLLEPHPISHLYQDEEIFSREEPFSWAKLMNHGFTRAKGKWILYGSDDIVLYPHSISLALEEAKRGKYQGGITFLHRNTVQTYGNYYRNFGFDSFDGKTFINFGLISSQAYRATDGFDERFRFYWADADLCMQIWQAGMKIGVSPYSLVDHINVDDTIRQENSRGRYRLDTRTYFHKWHGSALFTTERVLDRNRFVLRDEDAERITRLLTAPKVPFSRSGDAAETGTAEGSNGPESQAGRLFSSLLEAADVIAAVEKRREELSPELVALIEENARQAELDGENELAQGLTALSDHIAGYLRDQVRVQ